jgi:hypothetical protein
VRQPAFADAAFDTTYLDRVLAGRNGEPFRAPTPADEDEAAVAAALAAWFRAHRAAAGGTESSSNGWRRAARTEGLRTS